MDDIRRQLQRRALLGDEDARMRWLRIEASFLVGHFQRIWDVVRFVSTLCGGPGRDRPGMMGPNPNWGQMASDEIWLIQSNTGMPRIITTPLGTWQIDIPALILPTETWLPTLIEKFDMLPIWGVWSYNQYTDETELVGTASQGGSYVDDYLGACGPIWLLRQDIDGFPLPMIDDAPFVEIRGEPQIHVVQANITPISSWDLSNPRTDMYYSSRDCKELWNIVYPQLVPPTAPQYTSSALF